MKTCMSCKIKVGGTTDVCPLCLNSLGGEATDDLWPAPLEMKKQAFLYKLQLFIVLAGIVVALGLDFILELHLVKHWSLIVLLWSGMFEILLRQFLKKDPIVVKVIAVTVLYIGVLLMVTGWYLGFWEIVEDFILPGMISVSLLVNFILALIDKNANAMVYMLINVLIGVVSYVVLWIYKSGAPLVWTICLMVSVITFIGIIVFQGPKAKSEIQKRMNF